MEDSKVVSVQISPVKKCFAITQDYKDCYFVKFIRLTTSDDGSTSYYPIFEQDFSIGFGYNKFGNHCIPVHELQNENEELDLKFNFIGKSDFEMLTDNLDLKTTFGSKDKVIEFWKKEFELRGIEIKDYF